jgi:hypothetical protein
MTVIVDNKKRVTLPTKPGNRFDLQAIGDEQFILTRLEPVTPRPAKIIKRGGRAFLSSGRIVTPADVQKALEEFP